MGGFVKDRLVIGDEVQGTLAGAKDVFAGVGRISTVEDHGVVVFACDIEGEAKGIGAVSGAVVLGKGANKKRRHGKETRN